MMSYLKSKLNFKIILAIVLVGLTSGLSSSVFLYSLNFVTQLRLKNNFLIYFLPLGGLFSTFMYIRYGKKSNLGGNLIIHEINNPNERIPLRMAPFVFVGSLITHLFGGSAGREGAAVQMGGALAEGIGRYLKFTDLERRKILILGISASFGSAIGGPWAGMFFGSEVINAGKIKGDVLIESGIASWLAYLITVTFKVSHISYPKTVALIYQWNFLFLSILAGVIFGLIARIFLKILHELENKISKINIYGAYKTLLGGFLILFLYFCFGNFKYAGLGIEFIENTFYQTASLVDIVAKMLFTILTLVSGFKGGEFVPLVFIGAHSGSYLSHFFSNEIIFLTSLGFFGVYAGAANVPFTCVILACEFFGLKIFPFALIACYLSFIFSGNQGIYKVKKLIFKENYFFKFLANKLK